KFAVNRALDTDYSYQVQYNFLPDAGWDEQVQHYSLRLITSKDSTICLHSEQHQCVRITKDCSGLKCCRSSKEFCSIPHYGDGVKPFQNIDFDPKTHSDSSSNALKLAQQVFFFAQLNFPLTCKHEGKQLHVDSVPGRDTYSFRQRRSPNWAFRVGKKVTHTSPSPQAQGTKLPDFIGCKDFSIFGKRSISSCSLVSLPNELQGADPVLVNKIASDARMGIFPTTTVKNICSPVPFGYTGKHCPSNIHGYEAVPLEKVCCNVRYHFFYSTPSSTTKWVIIIGIGTHTHCPPVLTAPMNLVRPLVESTLSSNRTASTRDLCEIVENTFGVKAPLNSVLKVRYQMKQKEKPFGTNLESITTEYIRRVQSGDSNYIISVSDERVADNSRVSSDEVGVSIILCNHDLLKHSMKNPRYGCDGTFNVVSNITCEGLDFELNTIISKDRKTGKCFAVMRQLASRKTKGARKDLFKHFVDLLLSHNLKDPLRCANNERLSFTTEFETTYAISLCEVLAERFPSDDEMVDQREKLIHAICFGCNVHAHRSIQSKVDRAVDAKLYNWAMNTRSAQNIVQVEIFLQEFEKKGDN
ncbi:MAG: hypothetical protein AAF391_12780, partial [Bacteroidota bacterium]